MSTITKQQKTNNRYGVVLSEDATECLGKALQPYIQTSAIGQYIHCKKASLEQGYWILTLTPEQTGSRIKEDMTIWLPGRFVNFVAHIKGEGMNKVGFAPNERSEES